MFLPLSPRNELQHRRPAALIKHTWRSCLLTTWPFFLSFPQFAYRKDTKQQCGKRSYFSIRGNLKNKQHLLPFDDAVGLCCRKNMWPRESSGTSKIKSTGIHLNTQPPIETRSSLPSTRRFSRQKRTSPTGQMNRKYNFIFKIIFLIRFLFLAECTRQ